MHRLNTSLTAAGLCLVFAAQAFATTWFPKEFSCPLDGEKNTFMVVGSYGSYIYAWPSKYQWIFWPKTDSPTFYLCKKCHLATFMWDFDSLPKDKYDAIRKVLAAVKFDTKFKDYQEVPINDRLDIVEKVYAVLDKDDDWWNEFYRVRGYHFAKTGQTEKATEYRKKSLELTAKMLSAGKAEAPKKELLYISAAMKHFLNDDAGALADLNTALKTKFVSAKAKAEELDGIEKGMNERINDYIIKIKSTNEKPRLMDKEED